MKYYYYVKDEQRFGPFTLEEIKAQKIKKSTLIWADGMENWETSETIEELKDFLVSEPPPIPKKIQPEIKKEKKINPKYDLTYRKETKASFVGWLLLIIPVAIRFAIIQSGENFDSEDRATFLVFYFIMTIIVIVKVSRIAFRQNRDTFLWGFLAFFFPIPTLIIIGYLRKLRFKIDMVFENDMPFLLKKARKYYYYDMYNECIEVLNKANNLHPQNYSLIELRGCAYYQIGDFENSKNDFKTIINAEDKFTSIAELYLGNIAFKEHDREKAIQHWLRAKEKNNQAAINNLKKYHDYTHRYFLSKKEVKEKLGKSIGFAQARYLGNLFQTEDRAELQNTFVEIHEHKNGLSVALRKKYIAIAFYEIKSCIYRDDKSQFELCLSDNNSLVFDARSTTPFDINTLKEICQHITNNLHKI